MKQPADLTRIVRPHRPGTSVELGVVRAGKHISVRVPVVSDAGRAIIGVQLVLRYEVPVNITIDTSDVSGPSAGLAMALAIIDSLTPGELTGGKRVAVTGTIDPQGNVGQIGAIAQKAVSVRAAGARDLHRAGVRGRQGAARPTSRPRASASGRRSSRSRWRPSARRWRSCMPQEAHR